MHLTSLVAQKSKKIDKIVHIGAHIGQEVDHYISLNPNQVVFVEADPIIFQNLLKHISSKKIAFDSFPILINKLIGADEGKLVSFYRFNNRGESSSIFRSTEILREKFAGIEETGEVLTLHTERLDRILQSYQIEIGENSILVIDTQGAELTVLKSCGEILKKFRWVEVEVSQEPIYEGAPLYPEIEKFLSENGFARRTEVPWHGNVLYEFDDTTVTLKLPATQVEDINKSIQERNYLVKIRNDYLQFLGLGGSSKSQYAQDLFVLLSLNFKTNGFFVDFGATDGVELSNSYLLEKSFSWEGILAEPAVIWHDRLKASRKAKIDTRCVWKESGLALEFAETNDNLLSTIKLFKDSDFLTENRKRYREYKVMSVSLVDLLDEHQAPRYIDYLSIDTEGSEFEILSVFDFDKYIIKIITVEHNWTDIRGRVYHLLTSKGYRRYFEHISQCDDWYIKADV